VIQTTYPKRSFSNELIFAVYKQKLSTGSATNRGTTSICQIGNLIIRETIEVIGRWQSDYYIKNESFRIHHLDDREKGNQVTQGHQQLNQECPSVRRLSPVSDTGR
jgi:hypothetical protein